MTVRWSDGAVVSVAVKGDRRVLAQMVESPFLYFFWYFADEDGDFALALDAVEPIFCCAVTRQFLKHSDPRKEPGAAPRKKLVRPKHWINTYDGWRDVVAWPGTPHERELTLMGGEPGGMLVLREELVGEDIALDDDDTIDGHELTNIWTFPLLNERLHLCEQLERNIDPMKDLSFDRTPPLEARTFVDILAGRGDLASWGYATTTKAKKKKARARAK